MNLKRVLMMAAAPVLCGIGGAVCFGSEPDVNDAAATIIGTTARNLYDDLEKTGNPGLDRERFISGLISVFNGNQIGDLDNEQAYEVLRKIMAPEINRAPAVPDADEAAENAWVANQASLPRTEVLEGGVILQRQTEGSGDYPAAGSTVKVMYTGRLSNGNVFDSTEEPFDLPLNRVIPGLAKAIEQMRYGGTYRVFIPPAMGYGKESVMDLIPGNSALDFTIVILEK
ncbi:MAG: FKBP-type peptidyl-prolyl cis-trans isomerase [Muribaculaceae bacterium]|nr:FKBP-type peptidyl-prolyl cis-trans isomerase [Muribaculaceae bacterium]MDE7110437.1 FKBP-type peptidyl-prolyl cis-trans isomerase [Muribaculaceae bacterium]